MRMIGPDYGSPEVYRYLTPREQQVLTLRQHWAFLVPPAAAAVGAALAALVVTVIAPGATTLKTVAWVLAGFLIARLIVADLSWWVQYITVTNERVVLTSGILHRKVKIIPLPNFAEMTLALVRRPHNRIRCFHGGGDWQALSDNRLHTLSGTSSG